MLAITNKKPYTIFSPDNFSSEIPFPKEIQNITASYKSVTAN